MDAFGRPWKVIQSKEYANTPRIVDCNGKPVMSFGNQRRRRGALWAKLTADLIVDAVNNLKHLSDDD